MIARGEKAEEWMEKISSKALIVPCKKEETLQSALIEPTKESILRKVLFNDYQKKSPIDTVIFL